MTATVMVSIACALLAAFLYALSNVLEQSEAEQVPDEYALRPSLLMRLAGRPRWVLGFASDAGGYAASAAALSVGTVVFVEPIQSMGLLITLFLGSAMRRRRVTASDWWMALVLCGGLSLFLYETSPTQGRDIVPASRWFVAAPAILAAVMLCVALARVARAVRGACLGVAAAVLFAVSAVLTKAFVHYLGDGPFAWVPHWEPYVMALAILSGFVIGQSAFQAGSLAGSVAGIEAAEPIASVALGVGLLDESVSIGTPVQAAAVVLSVITVVFAMIMLARSEHRLVAGVPHADDADGHRVGPVPRRASQGAAGRRAFGRS